MTSGKPEKLGQKLDTLFHVGVNYRNKLILRQGKSLHDRVALTFFASLGVERDWIITGTGSHYAGSLIG